MSAKARTWWHRYMRSAGRPIVVWMDGAFDMMHFGHMNAFRQVQRRQSQLVRDTHFQGRSLGTRLVVGINDDEVLFEAGHRQPTPGIGRSPSPNARAALQS